MRPEIATHRRRDPAGHRPAEEASLTGTKPPRRLDELNAKAEDPAIWNNPQDAQKLMRERQKLDSVAVRRARAGERARRRDSA